VYDRTRQQFPHADDVLLWNERGELTEFCNANLVVEWQGEWYTPPVECGLLAGTFRTWLLMQGKLKEKVVHREDLHRCSRIFWINSVREICECVLVQSETVETS
jgi:para-aminobenzoate synthetase/4-amino-4-deoxychorismate lyase